MYENMFFHTLERDDGTLELCRYSALHRDLVIPGEIDGRPITVIGNEAFQGCKLLNSVVIPEGVTAIGERAFSDCVMLTRVTIPASVAAIAPDAFSGCPRVHVAALPGSFAEQHCRRSGLPLADA